MPARRLSPRKRLAVEILASGGSVQGTARKCAVNESTIRRWRKEAAVQAAIDEAIRELVECHRAGIRAMLNDALIVVRRGIRDGDTALAGKMLGIGHLAAHGLGDAGPGESVVSVRGEPRLISPGDPDWQPAQ